MVFIMQKGRVYPEQIHSSSIGKSFDKPLRSLSYRTALSPDFSMQN